MRPAIVMPLHDPDGSMISHLERITPLLKDVFAAAYLSLEPDAAGRYPERLLDLAGLARDNFFRLALLEAALPVGDHFHALYRFAASACPPDQVLHLCFPDRVSFALETSFKDAFLADVAAVEPGDTPMVFERSPAAWQTHPQNYVEIEHFATRMGELLLGKPWDFGWCHLALTAGQLKAALPCVRNHDLSMVAEILLLAQPPARAKAVDWLAWEDPFLLGADPQRLQDERQRSPEETRKRLSYILPIIQILVEKSKIP